MDPELRTESRAEILRDWYENHYSSLSASANGSGSQRYLHTQMEGGLGPQQEYSRVLEVGGNVGEHVEFVRHRFGSYVVSDLYAPQLPPSLQADPRISALTCDAADIPVADGSFDRLIATCLLHHVQDPLVVAHEMRRVVRPGGRITLMLPTDPSLAYRAGVALTSARMARRAGLLQRMELVKAIDHHNHYRSLATQLSYVFSGDSMKIRYLPTRVPLVDLNMFTVWQINRR